MKLKSIDIMIIITAIISFFILTFFIIKPVIGMFYNKYEGYVAFTEIKDNRYIVLVVRDIFKEEIQKYTNSELDKLAQNIEQVGTKGDYFSIDKSDFRKLEKGQKVKITYKKQASPDIWGYPLKASSVKIIDDKENNREKGLIYVPKDVKLITITGNDFELYSETEEQIKDRIVVFEQTKEIEVILKAIKDSTPHSGPMTDEGENFKIILSYKDDTSDTILLWLYPDSNSGRIQKENYSGPMQLLSKEDVQSITKLLDKKIP